MKNNIFIRSTLILLIGGLIVKILGFFIKVIYTRIVGEVGISLYTLVLPTYSLLITFAQLGLPIAISKLVAENKKSSKNIVFSIIPLMLILNLIIIILVVLFSPFIANTLLQQSDTKSLIIAISLTLPFISMTSILKGYFYGKQRMMPHTVANVVEQIIRLILIILVLPRLLEISLMMALVGMILLNIIAEIAQGITFYFFLPNKWKIKIEDIKPDKSTIKDIMEISLPTVSSRFIGNIGYFFEPILLTWVLLTVGYSSSYIVLEYGIFNAYALHTLLFPAFFIQAISSALVPEISKFYASKRLDMVKRRFKQAMVISALLGIFFSLIFFFFADQILLILYNTTSGSSYIKLLAPFFILFYIEGPLISTLQALGKSNITMKITFFGIILKLSLLVLLSFFKIGIYGLIISEIINIIFIVILNYKYIKKMI